MHMWVSGFIHIHELDNPNSSQLFILFVSQNLAAEMARGLASADMRIYVFVCSDSYGCFYWSLYFIALSLYNMKVWKLCDEMFHMYNRLPVFLKERPRQGLEPVQSYSL
jgi:hypothetical protein